MRKVGRRTRDLFVNFPLIKLCLTFDCEVMLTLWLPRRYLLNAVPFSLRVLISPDVGIAQSHYTNRVDEFDIFVAFLVIFFSDMRLYLSLL